MGPTVPPSPSVCVAAFITTTVTQPLLYCSRNASISISQARKGRLKEKLDDWQRSYGLEVMGSLPWPAQEATCCCCCQWHHCTQPPITHPCSTSGGPLQQHSREHSRKGAQQAGSGSGSRGRGSRSGGGSSKAGTRDKREAQLRRPQTQT